MTRTFCTLGTHKDKSHVFKALGTFEFLNGYKHYRKVKRQGLKLAYSKWLCLEINRTNFSFNSWDEDKKELENHFSTKLVLFSFPQNKMQVIIFYK